MIFVGSHFFPKSISNKSLNSCR